MQSPFDLEASELIGIALMGALGTCSFVVWMWALPRIVEREHPLPLNETAERAWNPAAAVVAAIWLANEIVARTGVELQWFLHRRDPAPPISLQDVQLATLFRLLLWGVLLSILAWSPPRLPAFGIDLRGARRQLADGVWGFFASLLPVGLVLVATYHSGLRDPERQHSFLQFLEEHRGALAVGWVAVSAVVVAPLTEELLFRVILQGTAERFLSPHWAVLLVAFLFSVVHGWIDALALFPLAVVLGYVYYRRHSYLAVVAIHALFNLSMLVLQLLTLEA